MTAPHTQCQPDITLVQDLHMDADMLKDGYQKNLTELWHSDVVREAAKNALRAADCIEELTKALEWRPIETAPTCEPFSYDPIEVLLWVADGGFGEVRGTVAFGRCYRSANGNVRAVASGYSGDWKVTHWKPMPGRPTPSVSLEDRK